MLAVLVKGGRENETDFMLSRGLLSKSGGLNQYRRKSLLCYESYIRRAQNLNKTVHCQSNKKRGLRLTATILVFLLFCLGFSLHGNKTFKLFAEKRFPCVMYA